MNAQEVKALLIAGNKRYISGNRGWFDAGPARRKTLAENGQQPLALIVGCSDSRVPPEVIFDRGIGDLFVVRTAGNVLDDVGLGSVEYGVEHLEIPLVIVLGHEGCGAVGAAVAGGAVHGCLQAVLEKIEPARQRAAGGADILSACEDENIRGAVAQIRENAVVREYIQAGKTTVMGAKYALQSGEITFFE